VGFPCEQGSDPKVAGLTCGTPIEVRIDGKRVRVKRDKSFYLWPMKFPAAQKVKLEVRYTTPLVNARYQPPLYGMGTLYYRLSTGARWQGPIGELNIAVSLPTDALIHIAPAGYTREKGRIVWKLTAYEPVEDLAILLHPMVVARDPKEGAQMMRREMKEMVRYAAWFQRVARERLGLPDPKEEQVRRTVEESAALMEK
jgi:hypothetical protein